MESADLVEKAVVGKYVAFLGLNRAQRRLKPNVRINMLDGLVPSR